MIEGTELATALEAIARTPVLLVAVDFDGTLSPTVDDPDAARALPEARSALLTLAALPSTRVALVSGRALGSLERVALLPPEFLLVGSHGAEFRLDGEESAPELSPEEAALRVRLLAALAEVVARHPGAMLEEKPAGAGLHTRTAEPGIAESARSAALEAVAVLDGERLSARYGKDILEFTLRTADKGRALELLRERTGATATVFLGDDVTDEDGFAVLEPHDLGVKVGEGESLARHRVPDPAAVASLLERLASLRSSIL